MLVAIDQVPIGTNAPLRESRLFPSTSAYVRRNALAIFRAYAMYEPLRVFTIAALVLASRGARRLDAVPRRLDPRGRLQRPHPVADPRRRARDRRGAALRARRDRRRARGPAGDDPARLRADPPGRAEPRDRALALRARQRPPRSRRSRGSAHEPLVGAHRLTGAVSAARAGHGGSYGRDRRLALGRGRRSGPGHLPVLRARVAQRSIKAEYGEIVVVWSAVFITVSTLYRPVEQLLSRTMAEREARGQPLGEPLRVAAKIQARGWRCVRGRRARAARAARGRPARRQRDPLLDPRRHGRSPTRRAYFARGLFAGHAALRLYFALMLLSNRCRASRSPSRSPSASPTGQTAIALGIVVGPLLSADRRCRSPSATRVGGHAEPAPGREPGARRRGGGRRGRSSRSPRAAGSRPRCC